MFLLQWNRVGVLLQIRGQCLTYNSSFDAAKAFDGNGATRWAASNSTKPQWLKVDLGQNHNISKCETYFEFPAKYYQYNISDQPIDARIGFKKSLKTAALTNLKEEPVKQLDIIYFNVSPHRILTIATEFWDAGKTPL